MIFFVYNPAVKAWLATVTFSLAGLISLFFFATVSRYLLPHAALYSILVLNTFFSVRFFAGILAVSVRQTVVDGVLVVLYVALAYSLGDASALPLAATCLFAVAAVKYIIELGSNPHTAVLRRKISIDFLGAALCAAALAGTILGYPFESAWALAGIFALANVYLLAVKPMYRL